MQNMLIKQNMKLRFSIKKKPRKCDLKNVAIVYIIHPFHIISMLTKYEHVIWIFVLLFASSLTFNLIIDDHSRN